jgi:hypothetical protein
VAVLSRHPPLRSQGARHSQPAGDGGEPLLGAVPAQMAIAVSLEARLSRPATSRTPSPIDEGRGSSGQGTAPCSSAQHTTNESSARHKAVGGGSHLMPSNANLQSNRAAIMWSFQVFAFVRSVRCSRVIPDAESTICCTTTRRPARLYSRPLPLRAGAAARSRRTRSADTSRSGPLSYSPPDTHAVTESDDTFSTSYIEDLRRNSTGCHALCPRTTGREHALSGTAAPPPRRSR